MVQVMVPNYIAAKVTFPGTRLHGMLPVVSECMRIMAERELPLVPYPIPYYLGDRDLPSNWRS